MYRIGIICILLVGIGFYIFQPSDGRWLKRKVTKKWMIPPELLDGRVIYIGDTYEDVNKKIPLEPIETPPSIIGISGAMDGAYYPIETFPKISFLEFYFNADNLLVTLGFNTEEIQLKTCDTLAQYLVKKFSNYYGDYMIYDWEGNPRHKVIEWQRPDSGYISLSYYPYILNISDSNRIEDISISINWDPPPPRASLSYPLSKNSRKELGLEP